MFGLKTPKVAIPHTPKRAALNMPGLLRRETPGLGQRAIMPHLTGGQGVSYDDQLRQNIMSSLKQ